MNKKLKKGIMLIFVANVINMFFSLLTNFLLPKYLSIESYAGIKEFQLYVSYVGLFHFGFVDGIYLKYGGKTIEKNVDEQFSTDLSTMRVFQIIITFISICVSLLLKDRILLIFALSIFPQNMANYYKFLYQATGEFELYGKAMNLTSISTFILNMFLLFVIKTDDLYLYIIGYLIVFIGIWVLLEYKFSKKHTIIKGKLFSAKRFYENIKSGFLLTLGNLSSMFLTTMDRWFVKFLLDTYAFAQYSFAVSVESFLNLAITPVTTTLYNYFCQENNKNEHQKIFNYVVVFASLVPASAFIVQIILDIFLIKYSASSIVIILLFASQMFYIVIKSIYVNLYKVQRKQKAYFLKLIAILFIGFIFNCICFYLIRSKEAFAIGTLLSSIVWFIISTFDFRYICSNRKVYLYLFLELVCFLYIGVQNQPIVGLIIYVFITITLCIIFMKSTFFELYNKVKFLLKKGAK